MVTNTYSTVVRSRSWALRAGFVLFLGASFFASSAAWAQTKIGFVRTERVFKRIRPCSGRPEEA